MAEVLAMMAGLGAAGKFLSSYPPSSSQRPGDVQSLPPHMQPNSLNMFESNVARQADQAVLQESTRRWAGSVAAGSRLIPHQMNSLGRPTSASVPAHPELYRGFDPVGPGPNAALPAALGGLDAPAGPAFGGGGGAQAERGFGNGFVDSSLRAGSGAKVFGSTPSLSFGSTLAENALGPMGTADAGGGVTEQEFQHNRWLVQQNMVPFYRGLQSRQPGNLDAANPNLERFTQDSSDAVIFKPPKREVLSMYETAQVNNVFPGMQPDQTYANLNRAKDAVSRVKAQGVPLNEPVRVGPGISGKYEAEPSGGRHPMFRPTFKTVDELRAFTDKQKIVMRGRVLPGQKGSRRGKVGRVAKERPETAYVPLDPVATRAEVSGDMAKTYQTDPTAVPLTSRVIRRPTTAPDQNDLQGPAAAAAGGREGARADYVLAPARNLYLEDQHGVGQTAKATARRPEQLSLDDFIGSKWAQPRPVMEDRLANPHNALGGSAAPVYDPDDVYATTTREVTSDVSHLTVAGGAGFKPSQGQVKVHHAPDDVPEQTARAVDAERFESAQSGAAVRQPVNRRTVKDPNDRPVNTDRGHSDIDPLLNAMARGPSGNQVNEYEQREFARTRRDQVEATVQEAVGGSAMPYPVFKGRGGVSMKGPVKDPEDIPAFKNQDGTVDGRDYAVTGAGDQVRKSMAHDRSVKTWVKPRQAVQVEYQGGARQDRGSGYMAAKWEQRYTQRQNMTKFLFKPAGAGEGQRVSAARGAHYQMDQCARKEALLKTQAPTLSGPSMGLGANQSHRMSVNQSLHRNSVRANVPARQEFGAAVQRQSTQPIQEDLNARETHAMPDRFLLPVGNPEVNVPGVSSTPMATPLRR